MKSAFHLARVLMSRAITVAGIVAVIGASVQGLAALEKLGKKPEDDEEPTGPGYVPPVDDGSPVDELEAQSMASVIGKALEFASDLEREAQDQMVSVVAQGMAKLRVPMAQRVTEILVATTGQTPVGAVMISLLLRKMWMSNASEVFFTAIRKQIASLKAKLPKSSDFESLFDSFFASVGDLATSAGDAFGSMVGGIYDFGKRAGDAAADYVADVRKRWSNADPESAEAPEEEPVETHV